MLQPIGQGLIQMLRAIAARLGASGSWRGALSALMGALGVSQVVDIVDQYIPGLGDQEREDFAQVAEALARLEQAGIMRPWNPRPRRDGSTTPGPFFAIIDLVQFTGHYTNFHMSRTGLATHDRRQDTPRRPRTAGRSRRSQN